MLVAAVVIVLLSTAAMFAIFGRIMEDRIDQRVEAVNRDFDRTLDQFRDEVRRELDGRVPITPTPTPFPTPTPTPTPTPEGEGSATPSPTASPDAQASPTATPFEEIRP